MGQATTHIFRVILEGDPTVLREIEVESRKSLSDLAKAIVDAFDFDFDHAFGFYPQETRSRRGGKRSHPKYELFADMDEDTDSLSVRKTSVAEAFPQVGHTMEFLFDYGDNWLFTVEVIGTGEKVPRTRYPKVLKKVGTPPEQYSSWEEDEEDGAD